MGFRPSEEILALASKSRSLTKRRLQSGAVLLNLNGAKISLRSLINGLDSVINLKYNHWIQERDYRRICNNIAMHWIDQDRRLQAYLELDERPKKYVQNSGI